MVRLYFKYLKKLKVDQNVAVVAILDNGKRYFEYYQFVRIEKYYETAYDAFKNLHNNIAGLNFKCFGQRYQRKWSIVHKQDDGSWSYVIYKYIARLSQNDEVQMITKLLSE